MWDSMGNKDKVLKKDNYNYHVIWSEVDNEYVGLCAEFPGMSWLAGTSDEELNGIKGIVADVVLDMDKPL